MAFSLAPMVILGIPNSSIFLLIYFVNHNFILLGTNKVVAVAAAIKVLRQSLLRERLQLKVACSEFQNSNRHLCRTTSTAFRNGPSRTT